MVPPRVKGGLSFQQTVFPVGKAPTCRRIYRGGKRRRIARKRLQDARRVAKISNRKLRRGCRHERAHKGVECELHLTELGRINASGTVHHKRHIKAAGGRQRRVERWDSIVNYNRDFTYSWNARGLRI